jgi:hypothetical protein
MYKYPQTIFDAIRQERNDFLYNFVEIVDGYTFNQYNNIKKIHKYYNSHYYDADYETINGITRKKVFWNICKRRATIASKQIDIDTKDFLLISTNLATEWNVHLLEKELKVWMKKEKYAKILNQISDELPIYGSVVLRKTKDGAELIDLRKFFCEQSAPNLKKSRYKIIKHEMTPEAMREMEGTWQNVREAINQFAITSTKSYETSGQINLEHTTPIIECYERFAEVPRSYFENEGCLIGDGSDADEDYIYGRFIVCGVDNALLPNPTVQNPQSPIHYPGLILFSEQLKKKDDPFKECHYRKTKGRWQGIGVPEDLFEDQRLINKNKDQEDKAEELASLILFQTATDMAAKNVLTDVANGEILKAPQAFNRLDNQNHALADMQKRADSIEHHADLTTFNADQLGGKEGPASATLGATKLQAQTAASVFDYMKEDYGIFLNEFVNDLVMPDLEKQIMSEHAFRYAGDILEMAKIRDRAIQGYLRTQILKTGDIPTQQEYQALVQEWTARYAKNGAHIWIQIEKDFFKNLDYEMSLEITGEGRDVQAWLNNLMTVFKLVSSNPLIMQNPVLKRLLYRMLTAMGMSVSELENADSEMTQDMLDAIIRMNTKRTVREDINFKDVPQQAQLPMLQLGGINVPQQPQQGGQQ